MAILAEIIARRAGREGNSLRHGSGSIRRERAEDDEIFARESVTTEA